MRFRIGRVPLLLFGLTLATDGAAQYEAMKLPVASIRDHAEVNGEAAFVRLTAETREAVSRGDYISSESLARRALMWADANLHADHPNTIIALNNLAAALYALGRYDDARPLFLRALQARERTLGPNHPDTLNSISFLAALYSEQGRYSEAEPLLLRALEIGERSLPKSHAVRLALMHNLASLYQREGRYAEAEPLYRRTIEAYEEKLGRNNEYTLNSVHGLATLNSITGRYSEAETLYLRLKAAYELSLGKEHPSTLQVLNNLAALYLVQGRYAEAEVIQLQVLETRERTLGRDHPSTHNTMDNLGAVYVSEGRYAEAEPLHRRSLEARERTLGANHPHTLISLMNLATLCYLQGKYSEAETLLRRASEVSERSLGPIHPTTINSAAMLAQIRLKASTQRNSALPPARLAVASLRSRRAAGMVDFTPPRGERGQIQVGSYFSILADAAWIVAQKVPRERAPLTAEAFLALQDSMAGTTDRAVVRMAVRHVADETASGLGALVRERDSLEEQRDANDSSFSHLVSQTDPAPSDTQLRRLRAEKVRIESSIGEIDTRLRRSFPTYFALVRPEALDVASAQALLAPDEAFLLVMPTEFGTHVMAISRTSVSWTRSNWTDQQVNNAVRRLLWDVGATVNVTALESAQWSIQGGSAYSYDRQTALALYRQIVAPANSVLQGKRHVFVAGGGSLTSFPFGILVTAEPQGADDDAQALRSTSWFADAHALIQIPSIQSLQFLRSFVGRERRNGRSPFSFIGFGDPILQGRAMQRGRDRSNTATAEKFSWSRTRSGSSVVDISQIRRLSRLPGTAMELDNMRRALGAPARSVFLGERATEGRLRTMDLSRTNILALATHGLMAGELRGAAQPGLVFTPPERATEDDDGFLTASEVAGLRLDADWVILSACNTAAGDGSQGAPGLSGLARAFFYAGGRNLLVSHWPVRDDVAARLTVRTIILLRDNKQLSRAEALQRAMQEIREDRSHDGSNDTWAHPSAWAPFSMIGDGAHRSVQ